MQEVEMQLPIAEPGIGVPVQPNTKISYLLVKRLMDIVASCAALVILSPVFLIVALAIKMEDPKGKIFYSQLRTGRDGRHFRLYKFRSMHSNADAIKALLMDQNEMDGPVFKIRNDPRITRIGRFIRKSSIDEMPQFLNVLRGDISLVGPRPLPVEEAAGCNAFQKQRELVRPGLTCTWQISGRNRISFERWMEMDVEYIAKQNIWVDLTIILMTVPAVFLSRGAC